ncbi:EAL domain-containing protein [Sulfurimonas sp.]|jgi:diguanylate cyclase (GGDEF)-like protein|uniref:EAL domain-containing protein n=1 Tax=Sulfurimonas sp. TaxID=2022749 RepID=UPI0025E16664|nr:EAL domain-containing protein [Sulfurimonas sp.]
MLLPQTKEREYRFKLALRMGLPIFSLIVALLSYSFFENYETLTPLFIAESILLLVFTIYFFLFLIYKGFDVKITDDVSKTFTREYLFSYLKKILKKEKEYALVLVSIDNLNDINTQYGINNGDKVLEEVAQWIEAYLKSQDLENYPMGHIKGGDFIIGFKGTAEEYNTTLELMCLKSSEFKVQDMEIKISGAITDTEYSRDLHYMIENLFNLQDEVKNSKNRDKDEEINPSELESFVINAIDKRSMILLTQDVFKGNKLYLKECFVKLKSPEGKQLFPKKYLKIINKLGLGVEYDQMVLEQLILVADKNITYAINITPTSLRNDKFLSFAKELLSGSDIKLVFILSEQEYFSHTDRLNSIIKSLKKFNVSIAIDRVGSLHTSFLYLRELNIDFIRFDNYYSTAIKLEDNKAIINGFNLIAHEKQVLSWMKNIEDEETLESILHKNIDLIQGKQLSDLEKIREN